MVVVGIGRQGGRIPDSLKAIFLVSNQGKEVFVPPTDNTASKVFRRKVAYELGATGANGDGNSNNGKTSILSKPQYARFQASSAGHISPQAMLHLIKLKERGYFPRNYSSRRSGYYNKPTEHQIASYGSAIIDTVKQNRPEDLRRMLECGLSPNACNAHGESLLHMVCRHGKTDLFRVLVAFDVDLQQTDDYGRTPLHDACWASTPSFEIAQWLILRDPTFLFLYDARGSLPLSYVTKANWELWRDFLEDSVDSFFPRHKEAKALVPYFCTMKPNTRPVPDPKHKIDQTLANMVASGAMTPIEAILALEESDDDDTTSTDDESTLAPSEFGLDDSSSSYKSFSESEEFDSDEEEELYHIAGHGAIVNSMKLGTIQEA